MKAIIVDDEQQSHEVLKILIEKGHPDIHIGASGQNVREGLALIARHRPDLVFLDVEMPDGTGFDLLEEIDQPDFHVVFITAHNKYAQDAVRFGALDFLLKPVQTDKLAEALSRVRDKQEEKATVEQWRLAYEAFQQFQQQQLPRRMSVSTMEGIHFIPVEDIIRFKADGNTTDIHIEGRSKPLIASVNLGEYVRQFELYPQFMKVHRSHLVNLNFVDMYSRSDGGYLVMKDEASVDVSRQYREELLNRLGGM